MEKNLLAAIMGAVAAYIQQEEIGRTSSGTGIKAERPVGRRELMMARPNVSVARLRSGKSLLRSDWRNRWQSKPGVGWKSNNK